ncbi:nuclear transport factor 2 family protein [Kribbella deserti]|uniref:Nuclear transport factor 2 family protein n=1 Tax=Kribbella deserti TaxID=1926257 RepID=A0ABV6QI82_9ACTN
MNALADQYFAMWNERDVATRRKLIEELWTTDGTFVDPMFNVTGHAALSDLVDSAHQLFPGHSFRLAGEVDGHNNRLRWAWELAAEGQPPVAGGIDCVTVAADGRLSEVVGFIDFAPPAA